MCPMLKAGKLYIIAISAILASLFKNLFKDTKIWWLFVQLYKNYIEFFALEVSFNTVSGF